MLRELHPLKELDCDWFSPVGGFFIWLRLPSGLDSEAIRGNAEANGVTYLSGHHCFADSDDRQHIRLAFSYLSEEELCVGTRRLVETIRAAVLENGLG